MTQPVDLNKYSEFVKAVTSDESNDIEAFIERLRHLDKTTEVNIPLLMTAAIGLSAEGGEFSELPKKIIFQGKEITPEVIFHMKRELGDIAFYWVNACRALNLDPNDVFNENVNKLESRYPGGKFDVDRSENRAAGDI